MAHTDVEKMYHHQHLIYPTCNLILIISLLLSPAATQVCGSCCVVPTCGCVAALPVGTCKPFVSGTNMPCPAGCVCPGGDCVFSAQSCDAGTYGPFTGQSSSSACVPCQAGYYSPSQGYSTCLQCVSGTYTTGPGEPGCFGKPCAVGNYGPTGMSSVAAATCSTCSVGTYAPTIGTSHDVD